MQIDVKADTPKETKKMRIDKYKENIKKLGKLKELKKCTSEQLYEEMEKEREIRAR